MKEKRVVITGAGVISPNGIGKAAYWQALKDGKSGVKVISRFDTNQFKTKLAGEVDNFKPEEFLGEKGLRNLDRSSRFICSTAKMALDDAQLKITEENTDEIGVCTGTTLSSLWNIAEFNRQVIQDGPLFTDVALFPGTVANAASSQISIKYNIQGFNTTISNGYTSSLDALKYAVDFIKFGRAKAVLVNAVESLSLANYLGFNLLGFLAGLNGEEVSCPFDKRRNGIVLSESAGTIIIEDEEYARKRDAQIYAEIKGMGNYFEAYKIGKYRPDALGLRKSMQKALENSGMQPKDIDYLSASANSVLKQDVLETKAIKEVFAKAAEKLPVSSIKSMIGEPFSAAGLMQIVAGIGNLRYNFLAPTINYYVKDGECDLDYIPNEARPAKINNILINNSGPGGNSASMVLSRYN